MWFAPEGEPNDEGEVEIDLFRFSTGDKDYREPLESEVIWHPHFDPGHCEANNAKDRKRLQKRFLSDAWHYLAATDIAQVRYLEGEMNHPDWPRWRSWFTHAKKFKRTRMRLRVCLIQRFLTFILVALSS